VANVFISHSSADNDWAEKIYVWLDEDGHSVFLDRDLTDGIVVGDEWERRLYERLRWADAVVCVVSEPYVESVWCAAEIGASLALGVQLLPVGSSQPEVRHDLLKTFQGVDAAKDPEAARAALRSRLEVIDGGGGWGWPDGKPPYPGLRPFELGDHRVFFGRSHEVSSITKRLRSSERAQSAILMVVGGSGCGKSSLVRAGVLPRIAGEDYWLALPPIVPSIDPLGSLVRAIADLIVARRISFDVTTLRKDIERDGLRAVAHDLLLAAGAPSHCKLLVVIDQFEELLTQADPAERSDFVAALVPALGGPVQALATMRSEYVDGLSKDPDLTNLGTRIHQVRPLESDALREVIEEPAKVAGLSFEDDLVSRLISDTGTGDALPLLAFTLEQLADGASRGDRLTHSRYDEIGGVQGALQRQADEALEAACDATGKTPGQVIDELLNLVTIDEQGRPSKRRLALDESSDHEETLKPFLERRLLSTEVADKATSITVSHDAFLVNWPPLNKEIDAKVIALRTRRVVETEARDWEANKRDAAMLLQGPKLAKALVDTGAEFEPVRDGGQLTTRVDLNDSARDFLTWSQEAERTKKARARKRRVGLVAFLSVITLVAVIGAGVAVDRQQDAKKSERDAIAQRLIAEARVDLFKAVDATDLQRLLAGRTLAETKVSDDELYPVVVGSASTFKIMQNPLRPDDDQPLPVQSVAVSRNGALIAAGSNDNTLRLWDARSGELVRAIDLTGPGSVGTVAFDPSGTRIAVGSNDGTLQVIDAQNGERIGTVMPHPGAVASVAFGHDGQWIATGDNKGTVRLWDVMKGADPVTIPADPDARGPVAKSVVFSPAGDVVASANGLGVRLLDARDGHTLARWESKVGVLGERPGYPVTSVAFNHAGDRLVVGGNDGNIDLLDARTLQPLATQRAHPAIVNSLAFSTDGKRIVSGGDDNAVKVWDAESLTPLGDTFRGHGGYVTSVAFTEDGTRIVSGSVDGTVRVWNAVFGLTIPADQGGSILAVDFSPDNRIVASGGVDGTVKLWDTRTAGFIKRLGAPSAQGDASRAINSLAFYGDGNRVVTASNDGRVLVWDTVSGGATELDMGPRPVGLPVQLQRMMSVAVDRDENYIAAGGFDGRVRLWDADSLELIDVLRAETTNDKKEPVPYQVWSVAFSPNGRQLVTGSGADAFRQPRNLLQVWNLDTRTPDGEPMQGPEKTTVFAVAFVSDDRLVSGSSDGTVRVWDMKERKTIRNPFFRDQSPVYSLAVAHNDPWITAGGGGKVVQVWDIREEPPEETPLEGHQDWVHSVAVSTDDTLIASGSADGNLRLWPGRGDVGEAICSKLTVNPSHDQWDAWVEGKKDYEKLCSKLEPAPDA
jgi:WD40 repeat protein